MRSIVLTQNKVALVDDADYENVNQFKWSAHCGRGHWYAIRNKRINGKCNIIYLHRYIMQAPTGVIIDHIDRDGLNCQRHNMRLCTHSENMRNASCKANNKGVSVNWCNTKFTAQIYVLGKKLHLGSFDTEVEAAAAYNEAAEKYFGKFARLNNTEIRKEEVNLDMFK